MAGKSVNDEKFREIIKRIISKIENNTPKEELIEYLSLMDADEMLGDEMTEAELNAYLDLIASLIEAKAKTPEEAAQIIRECKVKI